MARSASDTMPDIFTNGPRASQSRRLVRRSRARLHSGFPALGERLVRRSPLPILLLDAVIVVFAAVSGPLEPFALQNRIDLLTRTSRWPSPLRRGCSPGRPAAGASSTLRAMGEIIEFPSNGGADQGYLAVPASGSGPGVVVIQEWWGLVDHIKDVCDRFAEAGFVALAPDLYHGRSTTEPDEAAKAMMALRMEQAARDMSGAVDEVQRRSSGNAVGVIGFCMGGGLALVLATQRPDAVKAVVPCYGLIPWPDARPDYSALSARVQGHYAENDEYFSPENAHQLADELARSRQGGRHRRPSGLRACVLQRHETRGAQPRRVPPPVGQRHRVLSGHVDVTAPRVAGGDGKGTGQVRIDVSSIA